MSKVFGVGLSKTGTNSLTDALNMLGYRSIHYPHDHTTYHQLRMADFKLSVMDEYDGATDLSIAPYYAELDQCFPNSKFILTVRDKPEWLKSNANHWKHNKYLYDDNKGMGFKQTMGRFVTLATYGCYQFHESRFSRVYDIHCKNVKEYFGDRLLVINICGGEGWEKLCPFLDKPVPSEDFPWSNKGIYE